MISNENAVHATECKCLAWRPIFAGALIAIGLSFLLNLFSVAVGLTAFTTSSEGVASLAFGGLLGTAIGIVASMFAAGWLTGYLGQRHCHKRHLGALYGFLAWCLALIFMVLIVSYLQQYVYFYEHFISGAKDMLQISNIQAAPKIPLASDHLPEKTLAMSAYVIFGLFFLSAFSCSLGGHCGMRYECKKQV